MKSFSMFCFCILFFSGCQATPDASKSPAPEDDSGSTPPDQEIPSCALSTGSQQGSWERLGSPIPASGDAHVAPSLVVVEDELWLYYAERENMTDNIYLLKSSDGTSWSEPQAIASLNDQSEIKHLHIRMQDGLWSATIGGGRIWQATSGDGLNWEMTAQQIVPQASFDSLGQLYPVVDRAGTRMWFSGFDGRTFAIGLASKIDQVWQNQQAVLEAAEDLPYENTAVAQSAIYESPQGIMMWYGGYDTSNTDPGPWRLLAAWSTDGITWERQGLALDLTASGEEAWSVREPSVVLWKQHLWLAYIAMGDDGIYRLRMARCP